MNRHTALLVGRARRVILSLGLALIASSLLTGLVAGQDQAPKVYVLPTSGIVDQVMAGYLHDAIDKAGQDGAAAVVVELSTPGGDLVAMRDIVTTFLSAPVPVIVWVGPGGSRAASAGTFITLAANIAVMAPGTNIGAATPVDSSGQAITGPEGTKVLQDAEALLRSIATQRNRNYDWALTTVTDAKSYTAEEAVADGGVNGLANSVDQAIAFADGQTVTVGANHEQVTLNLTGAVTSEVSMNPLQGFLHLLSDPNIAFILFTLGFYGLIFELASPNFVTGTIGGISIILAFIGFGSLPLNIAGLLLIVLGVVLFVLELHVVSHGLLTVGAIACFALGAAALYTTPGTPAGPDVSVALPVIVTMTVLTGSFMVLVTYTAVRSRRNRTAQGLIGATISADTVGEVRRPLTPIGSVYAGGEEWTARAADERPLPRGTAVKIIRQEGLTLIVEPTD